MITSEYKQQGDGRDSWEVTVWEDDTKQVIVDKYMAYDEDPTNPIVQERLKYEKRAKDGMKAYLNLMAEFRVNGNPREVNRHLEDVLETVRNEVTNGQWITALEKLDAITPQGHLTQDIYDRIHLSLTTYIQDNY